jgi:hypothetical protein
VSLLSSDGGACTVANVCSLRELPIGAAASKQMFVQRIAGDWALCGSTSVFGTHEAGLAIVADGTWYKLLAAGGTLSRSQGFGEQGTWDVIDTTAINGPGAYQLDFNISGGGGIGTFPAFATNPSKMRLNNNGVYQADYVFAACP